MINLRVTLFGFIFASITSPVSAQVVLNEFLPDPTDVADNEGEWVELFNQGDGTVDLTGFVLKDAVGASLTIGPNYLGDQDAIIQPKSFKLIKRNKSSFSLNNDTDQIYLYASQSGSLLDSISYGQSDPGFSFGRFPDGVGEWHNKLSVTANNANIYSPPATPTPSPTPSPTPTPTPTPVPPTIPNITPTPTPKPSPSISPSPKITPQVLAAISESSLSASESSSPTTLVLSSLEGAVTASASSTPTTSTNPPYLIASGFAFISVAGVRLFHKFHC